MNIIELLTWSSLGVAVLMLIGCILFEVFFHKESEVKIEKVNTKETDNVKDVADEYYHP